jgi:4-diphosphocytidyl-2-C-methyl-D-erythritol kinase
MRVWLAPAKINLSLGVGEAGADGRHPLDSLVAFTRTIGDKVQLARAQTFELTIEGPFAADLADERDNLILRAARLLASHIKTDQGARIVLTKNLPIASGIGGGSADAAATLIGLNQLWHGGLSVADLMELGAQLGADVPACVYGKALRMVGTGEAMEPIEALPRLGIVMVNPLTPCPTGPVYRAFDSLAFDRPGRAKDLARAPLPALETQDNLLAYLASHPNDLEQAAIQCVPDIAEIIPSIAESGSILIARMSGSGATCFGLYPTLGQAQAAARDLKQKFANRPVWVAADEINV